MQSQPAHLPSGLLQRQKEQTGSLKRTSRRRSIKRGLCGQLQVGQLMVPMFQVPFSSPSLTFRGALPLSLPQVPLIRRSWCDIQSPPTTPGLHSEHRAHLQGGRRGAEGEGRTGTPVAHLRAQVSPRLQSLAAAEGATHPGRQGQPRTHSESHLLLYIHKTS